jgi:hypothetical protein
MLLLATLSEYMGYNLTLLAGRVSTDPEVDIQLVGSVAVIFCFQKGANSHRHQAEYGEDSEGKMFAKWDDKIYHSTLQGFSRFVWAACKCDCLSRSNADKDLR